MEIRITRRNRDVVSDTRYKPFGCGESCNANISMPYFLWEKTPKTSKHYCYLACVHIKRIRGMFASSHNNGRLLVKLIFIVRLYYVYIVLTGLSKDVLTSYSMC